MKTTMSVGKMTVGPNGCSGTMKLDKPLVLEIDPSDGQANLWGDEPETLTLTVASVAVTFGVGLDDMERLARVVGVDGVVTMATA